MMRIIRLSIMPALLIGMCSSAVHGQSDISQYPRSWYVSWQKKSVKNVVMLTVAYELDEGQRMALINELDGRIKDQWRHMQDLATGPTFPEVEDKSKLSEEQQAEIQKFLKDFYRDMPMNPDRIADWVEQELNKGQAPLGRVKYKEMLAREMRQGQMKIQDPETKVRVRREVREGRANCIAVLDDRGRFFPADVGAAARAVSDNSASPSGAADETWRTPELQSMPSMPCFDEWRTAAAETCRTARTRRPAELASLWSEFTMRAWRRVAMEPMTFHKLMDATSNVEFTRILEDRAMQPDLDALFQEFKMRLEAIESNAG